MSGHYNAMFGAYTQGFIRQHFVTAVRLPALMAGNAIFDLNHHMVNHQQIVTLDPWSMQSTEVPLRGYWVPQGGSCVVPVAGGARRLVFTPDFSGCSILVDQISPLQYRVYHVQGGANYLHAEYLAGPHAHGLGLAGAMTFDDYGDAAQPRGFAFLLYEAGRWWIYYQRQTGIGLNYNAMTGNFAAMGPQTVRGGARIPVADLTFEVPRLNACHSGQDLPVTRNIRAQRQMLPNDLIW